MGKSSCTVQNCDKPIKCKGLCHNHYNKTKYNSEKQSTYDRSPERRYKKLINYCTKKEIPFDISFEDWKEILKHNKCHYCPNELPTNGYGLDRKYPNVGYFKLNVVPCCDACNKTKRDLYSHIEFKIMMDALNDFRRQIQNRL